MRAAVDPLRDVSLNELVVSANYTVSIVYPWVDWQVGALEAADANYENFKSSCWSCFTIWYDKYQVEFAWLPKNASASLPAEAAQQIQSIVTVDDSAIEQVWTAGQCVSGTWLFGEGLQYVVISSFGDRLVSHNGDAVDVYAWGAEGVCVN